MHAKKLKLEVTLIFSKPPIDAAVHNIPIDYYLNYLYLLLIPIYAV